MLCHPEPEFVESLEKIAKTGNDFAQSLLFGKYGFVKRGYLTENQYNAAARMIEKYSKGGDEPPTDTIRSLDKLYGFLRGAREHLKHPKLMMAMGERFLKIYIAGQRSRYPDTINIVTDDGVWLGRIFENGTWQHRQGDEDLRGQAKVILEKIADDPVSAASESGHLSGNCCFCHRPLTDERSTEVGYGPVCADHWGLPWG